LGFLVSVTALNDNLLLLYTALRAFLEITRFRRRPSADIDFLHLKPFTDPSTIVSQKTIVPAVATRRPRASRLDISAVGFGLAPSVPVFDTYLVSHARVLKTISLYSAFVFVRWAHSARRWRIDRLAKHRRCMVVVQANPTGTAAAAATSTSAGPQGQPCVRLLNAGSLLLVEDVECRKADIGDLFFTQHHLLAATFWTIRRRIATRRPS
jgi:hypothetical protein